MHSFNGLDSLTVCRLIRNGDQKAFREVAGRFDRTLRQWSGRYAVDSHEQEDYYQEGLVGLYQACLAYRCDGGASFATFAGVCIRHAVYSAVRKNRALQNAPIRFSLPLDRQIPESFDFEDKDPSCAPEQRVIDEESYAQLCDRIRAALSSYERQVLKLYLQGLSYDAISEALDRNLKSVDNAVRRIRGKLKVLIE